MAAAAFPTAKTPTRLALASIPATGGARSARRTAASGSTASSAAWKRLFRNLLAPAFIQDSRIGRISSALRIIRSREKEEFMRKFVSRALVFAIALMAVASMSMAADGTWTGYVTETHCGAKGAKAEHHDCAVKCVKEKGAKWALFNPADKSLFVLSGDDAKAEEMAGKKVTVKGTMDKEKKTINVATMEQGA
jgi:hypothetical protein